MQLNDVNTACADYQNQVDEGSLNALLGECHRYALRLAQRHRAAEPDDLAQEIVATAWTSLARYTGRS